MIALVFGSNGQDGYYLSELLRKHHIKVMGVSRSKGDILGDISDASLVKQLILKYQPNYIFHFAANSTTHFKGLLDNQKAIVQGTINLLENVRLHCPSAKVFLSGSALQFKNQGLPIDESTAFAGETPYSIARIHSTYMGRYYRNHFGIRVYIGYFFNHDSPLRSEKHVNQKIAAAVKRIAQGSQEKLYLGNIEVEKEFNYAGDVVEALWILVNQNQIFEAVIGCGQTYRIQDWLNLCFNRIGKSWKDYVILDKDYAPEYRILLSQPKLIKSLGWSPKLSFEQLADLMLFPQQTAKETVI
jgi:GDPmannose 4,6-dehydratase